MGPESIYSVFALFVCFGAILYEMLIAVLMDLVYQSDAYEAPPRGFGEKGEKGIYIREQRKTPKF